MAKLLENEIRTRSKKALVQSLLPLVKVYFRSRRRNDDYWRVTATAAV